MVALESFARILFGAICLTLGGLWMWFFGGMFRETDDIITRCVILGLEPIGMLGLIAGAALLFPQLNLGERLARHYRFVLIVLMGWVVVSVAIVIYHA